MSANYERKTEAIKEIKRARKALVIEWPDQRTVFEKNKGRNPTVGFSAYYILNIFKSFSGKIIGGTVAGVVGAVAIPITLPLLGFTSAGVAAGSVAASIQSSVYGAWTGGVFALAQSAGAAGVAATTTAAMATAGASAGLAIGAFADHSSSRQQSYVRKMKRQEHAIHIYPDKIYIGLKRLPGTPDIRKLILKDNGANTSKSVIILGGRQFTIYDSGFDEETIDITDGYLWLIQYDNTCKNGDCENQISLKGFRNFLKKSSNELPLGEKFNFNNIVEYLGISLESIPHYSYVIDGGDKCHFTKWSPLAETGMVPILVPNIGFKKFSEIKPDLETWMKNINADTYTIEPIHKTKNDTKTANADYFLKETYTGR